MYRNPIQLRAVLLSQEEALALLEMCLNSNIETENTHEQAITKITEMARCYLSDEVEAEKNAPVCQPCFVRREACAA